MSALAVIPALQAGQLSGLNMLASLAAAYDGSNDDYVSLQLLERLLVLASGNGSSHDDGAGGQQHGTRKSSPPSPVEGEEQQQHLPSPAEVAAGRAEGTTSPTEAPVDAAVIATTAATESETRGVRSQASTPEQLLDAVAVQCAALEALGNLAFSRATKLRLLSSERLMQLLLELVDQQHTEGDELAPRPEEGRLRLHAIRLLAVLGACGGGGRGGGRPPRGAWWMAPRGSCLPLPARLQGWWGLAPPCHFLPPAVQVRTSRCV